ncbi:MAG: amidophosphoribosyltransferase, partial [Syntrophorhabdales bacterium]
MACGVLGIVLKEDSEKLGKQAKEGLMVLNHRGEVAHGFSFLRRDGSIETRHGPGLVRDSKKFDEPIFGSALIGHTRYITSSTDCEGNTQPIEFALESGATAAIAHNGNVVNDKELASMFGIDHKGASDTKILGMMLGKSL